MRVSRILLEYIFHCDGLLWPFAQATLLQPPSDTSTAAKQLAGVTTLKSDIDQWGRKGQWTLRI